MSFPTSLAASARVAVLLGGAALAPGVAVHAQVAPPTCDADSNYHRLDFWVGEWRVTVDGVLDGTDRVEKALDGCAVMEHWHDGSGGADGLSLFYVAPPGGQWKQVWVTASARALGGLKEKRLIAVYPGGATRFQGELTGPLGRTILDRTTLTPSADGTVLQVIEQSTDGGTTWRQAYRATYTRIKS